MTPGSPQTAHLQHQLRLPPGFRLDDVFAFHRRDAQALAEEVSHNQLVKGLVWRGAPALLTLTFAGDAVAARLDTEALATAQALQPHFEAMVARMLGLTQDVEAFEQTHRHHPALGPLLARQSGLRVPVTATPITPQEAEAWLAPLSPWRALVAAHLWASLSMNA